MLENYVHLLKEHDLKVTPQRLEILKFLDSHRTHPTAHEIYQALKKRNPSLSKTTVYNSIDILKKYDILHELTISGTEKRYDFRHEPHHHFLCKQCGAIIDIDIACPNIEKVIEDGYYIEEVHGYFKGTCKQCRKKEEQTHGNV